MAEGKYTTFMDSDDEFYDNTSLMKLVKEMDNNPKLDMVSGLAYEEYKDGSLEKRDKNFIWVFGKLFRTQFFVENKMNFNDTRANEDNGFTTLFRMLTDNYKFIDEIVYIWHYEPNSITRKNGHEYYFYSIEGYVNNMIWVYNECKKKEELTKELSSKSILLVYGYDYTFMLLKYYMIEILIVLIY